MTWYDQPDDKQYKDVISKTNVSYQEYLESKRDPITKDLNDRIFTSKSAPQFRRFGYHASQLHDICVREEFFKRVLPHTEYEPDNDIEDGLFHVFSIGHAVHSYYQNEVFGKSRVIKGIWKCSRCLHVETGYMPKGVCPSCNWARDVRQCTSCDKIFTLPKMYPIQERQHGKEGCSCGNNEFRSIELSCSDERICRWPSGVDDPKKDCGQCQYWGRWRYIEMSADVPEWGILGHVDGIIEKDGEDCILDIKTMNPFTFAKLDAAIEKHVSQVNIYMWGAGLKKAFLLYMNKSSGEMKTFEVPFLQPIINRVKRRITSVNKAVKDLEAPMGVCDHHRDERAKSCQYSDICFKDVEYVTNYIKENTEKTFEV